MNNSYRRQFLKAGVILGSVLTLPKQLLAAGTGTARPNAARPNAARPNAARPNAARPDAAFSTETFDDAISALFGSTAVEMSEQVTLTAPDIAENGAVVPLGIKSDLKQIDTIAVFIKDNPNPLTASFDLGPGAIADINTRVKMGRSSVVLAVVRSGGKLYGSEREVKVTIGGCGG